jgi:hypothetical protein
MDLTPVSASALNRWSIFMTTIMMSDVELGNQTVQSALSSEQVPYSVAGLGPFVPATLA